MWFGSTCTTKWAMSSSSTTVSATPPSPTSSRRGPVRPATTRYGLPKILCVWQFSFILYHPFRASTGKNRPNIYEVYSESCQGKLGYFTCFPSRKAACNIRSATWFLRLNNSAQKSARQNFWVFPKVVRRWPGNMFDYWQLSRYFTGIQSEGWVSVDKKKSIYYGTPGSCERGGATATSFRLMHSHNIKSSSLVQILSDDQVNYSETGNLVSRGEYSFVYNHLNQISSVYHNNKLR